MKQDYIKIQEAWKRYIGGSESIPAFIDGVRQEITESWRRAKGKVDPFAPQITCQSAEIFQDTLRENALLIQIAYPYLQKFYEYLRETGHQITLADLHGCQLKRISGYASPDLLSIQNLFGDGAVFSEDVAGTNGIGTCLVLQKPIVILGAEHFLQIYNNMVCYASPIYDPSGKLLGCINITGPLDAYQPIIMGMLQAAINGIEREFKLMQTNNMLNSMLESFNSGVFLLDADKRILHYNQLALRLLQLDGTDLLGKSIFSVIQQDSFPPCIRQFDQNIANVECALITNDQKTADVILSVNAASTHLHGLHSPILFVNSQHYLHRLTNNFAGFSATYTFDSILGESAAIKGVVSMGKLASQSSSPVLIFGEPGTEKDVIAQAIHNASSQCQGPFVTLNCNAIPKAMLATELFGIETDSNQNDQPGKLELANGGTLFINEIGELPLELQSFLLSFLQTGTMKRTGSGHVKNIQARIITAASTNLLSLVQKELFRDDLYYRINTLNITIPPLRERTEDIPLLAEHFAIQYRNPEDSGHIYLDKEAVDALLSYDWPSNLRELETTIESAVSSTDDNFMRLSNLPSELVSHYYASIHSQQTVSSAYRIPETIPDSTPEDREFLRLTNALRKENGNVKQAALILNLPLSTFYRKLNKYNLDAKDFRQHTF